MLKQFSTFYLIERLLTRAAGGGDFEDRFEGIRKHHGALAHRGSKEWLASTGTTGCSA